MIGAPLKTAYLGPEGTFSHFAACAFLEHVETELISCPDLPAIFEAVDKGLCQVGLVPLENSLRGTVVQSFDLFLRHPVAIAGELFEPISHCLLGGTAGTMDEVRAIYSHPQPLAQCSDWLRATLPAASLLAVESTAAAACKALEAPGAAAVGHIGLADIYGLTVLARAIEDEPDNLTRFVAIIKEADPELAAAVLPPDCRQAPRERTSLLFTLSDKPGALAAVLNCLAEASINMRKLESRPLRGKAGENWKYTFFVDVECDMTAPAYAPALGRLCACVTMLRVLGSYPQGPHLTTKG